jgi:uncharacterized protein YvpB
MKNMTEAKFTDTILPIPYVSQYLDVKEKKHALTACGMTNVYMILKYFGANGDSLDDLVEKGIKDGGYGKSGWIHDYLIEVFKNHGIESYRMEKMLDKDVEKIKESIKSGNPVIVSVQQMLFDRRMFHMILIIGVRENENRELLGFLYHDPAGTKVEEFSDLFVSIPSFLEYWRRMAIFPHKKTS